MQSQMSNKRCIRKIKASAEWTSVLSYTSWQRLRHWPSFARTLHFLQTQRKVGTSGLATPLFIIHCTFGLLCRRSAVRLHCITLCSPASHLH
jgi:hypothetical protein